MLLDDFKNIVNRCSPTITSTKLLEVCGQLGIDTSKGCSGIQVSNKLYQIIKESLTIDISTTPNKISRTELLKLQSELVYKYVLDGEIPTEYLIILKVINDACRSDAHYFPPFSDTLKWDKAITNCKNHIKFSPQTFPTLLENIRMSYPKDFDRAQSVKELIKRGCKIEIINSDIQITSGLKEVANELNEKVKQIGGITLAKFLFGYLNKHGRYSQRFERYFIIREASGIGFDQKPQIPFGYLLNLSLKHPHKNSKVENPDSFISEIIDLAIIITNGAYGVQSYIYWEYYFKSGDTIIELFKDIALWDSIFSIPQCKPSLALDITDNLFSFIDEASFKNTLGFTKEELMLVSNEIHSIANELHEPSIIYYPALSEKISSVEGITIKKILDFLSHTQPVNEMYVLPSDYSSINFFKKPLIKLEETRFLLMNKSWCAPNYFEALFSQFLLSISELSSKIGTQLEKYVQGKLTEKGITFSTGEYQVDATEGECDIVIESEKGIVLIECKKKVLTGKSKSGIDTDILIDLSDSILEAQRQAGRTEIILREKGRITLNAKDGNTKVIIFNNRKTERVALTQLEFGGFQDKNIINQFLNSILAHSFGTNSTESRIVKKIREFGKKQNEMIEQHKKLLILDPGFSHYPYLNCWFLNLPQLLELINISTDNNSFYNNFSKIKHITMNTLDWYFEFDMATKLSSPK